MFTFSFSSAFATPVAYTAEKTAQTLYTQADYVYSTATGYGAYGVTAAYKAELLAKISNDVNDTYDGAFPTAEQAKFDAAVEKATAAINAAATANAAKKAYDAYEKTRDLLFTYADQPVWASLTNATMTSWNDALLNWAYGQTGNYVTDYGIYNSAKKPSEATNTNWTIISEWLADKGYYGFDTVEEFATAVNKVSLVREFVRQYEENFIDSYDNTLWNATPASLTSYAYSFDAAGHTYAAELCWKLASLNTSFTAMSTKMDATVDDIEALAAQVKEIKGTFVKPAYMTDNSGVTYGEYVVYKTNGWAVKNWQKANLKDKVAAVEKLLTSADVLAGKAAVLELANFAAETYTKYEATGLYEALLNYDTTFDAFEDYAAKAAVVFNNDVEDFQLFEVCLRG